MILPPKIINRVDTLEDNIFRENKPQYIILHSTNKYKEFEELLNHHKKDRLWAGMGYHLFLSKTNILTQGRPFNIEGAHSIGFNTNSIGFCIQSDFGERLNPEKVEIAKNVIKYVAELYHITKIMSHTESQIKYVNSLIQKFGIEQKFEEDSNIRTRTDFEYLRNQMNFFTENLKNPEHTDLKNTLKQFKFCPGELFYQIV